jgi:hypothetical protein
MRTRLGVIASAALIAAFPAISSAQNQTPPPAPPPVNSPAPAQPPPPPSRVEVSDSPSSQWMASGFVGSNFGAAASNASVDFGGQLAWLYRGAIGAEFLADFAPNFRLNNALLADNPNVNSYMVNVIGAVPIGGSEARVQPYVSGGLGGVQLRSDMINIASAVSTTTPANQMRFGGNVGAGVMAFSGNVGIRADVRYYRAFTNNDLTTSTSTPADVFAQNLLSGLDFWRANLGIAVRW